MIILLFSVLFFEGFVVGQSEDEPPGPYLREDDHRPLSLPIRKLPSSQNGCDDSTKFIVGIISRPREFDERDFIRRTWGLPAYRQCRTTKLIFLMGKSDDLNTDIRVSQEANKYQDVLLLDYHESYYNVSRKVFGYFRYVYDHCPNVKCVLKGDSDAIMNLSGMEKLCDVLPDEEYLVTGRRIFEPEPDRVPWTKHYVPYFVWPDNYPPFVFGFSYMFSGYGVVPKLLVTLQQETPFLNSENYRRLPEDIVFAGIIREIAHIPLNHNDGFAAGGVLSPWIYDGRPVILSTEAKDKYFTLAQISINRLENFPEYSSEECYLMSLNTTQNEPSMLQMPPLKIVPKSTTQIDFKNDGDNNQDQLDGKDSKNAIPDSDIEGVKQIIIHIFKH